MFLKDSLAAGSRRAIASSAPASGSECNLLGFDEGRWILSLRVCCSILRFLISGCLRVKVAVESNDQGRGGAGSLTPVGWCVEK